MMAMKHAIRIFAPLLLTSVCLSVIWERVHAMLPV